MKVMTITARTGLSSCWPQDTKFIPLHQQKYHIAEAKILLNLPDDKRELSESFYNLLRGLQISNREESEAYALPAFWTVPIPRKGLQQIKLSRHRNTLRL